MYKYFLAIFVCLISLIGRKCESCGKINLEDINLVLLKKDGEISADFKNILEIFEHDNFDLNKETIIYTFDFLEKADSISVKKVSFPFLNQSDKYNFLLLDYGKLSAGNYIFDAVPNAIKIGKVLGKILTDFHRNNKIDIKRVTLLGFSLGAHIMGEVGRSIVKTSNNTLKISKIIGLDPCGPAFYPLNPYVVALNKNDAEYVQIIHTDIENFGIPVGTGHADFWPNGGKNQPNCPNFDKSDILKKENQCSHLRSVDFFAESVASQSSFAAIECDSWTNFQINNCSGDHMNVLNHMGYNANAQIHGKFYLLTNAVPKYSKDFNGIFNI